MQWLPATRARTTVLEVADSASLDNQQGTMTMVELGKKAPDFKLPTDGGSSVALKDLRGRKVVVYFYPKDDTPGCTTEACGFRDALPDFAGVDAAIIGISKDSVAQPRPAESAAGKE